MPEICRFYGIIIKLFFNDHIILRYYLAAVETPKVEERGESRLSKPGNLGLFQSFALNSWWHKCIPQLKLKNWLLI
jgi:hypothetical protein